MRYRKLTPTGDYDFGNASRFLANTPETVAQAVGTRLRLYREEWFLDKREGLDLEAILGYGTQATRDLEVQRRILDTQGVTGIASYSSSVQGREFRVSCTIETVYGQATVEGVF